MRVSLDEPESVDSVLTFLSGYNTLEYSWVKATTVSNFFPGNGARNACWRFTAVALHLGVFQGVVFFLKEALW